MSKFRALVIAAFVLSTSLAAVAQTPKTLQLNTPVGRKLGAADVHDYTLTLEENTYVQLIVEQRGIDILVKVFSPTSGRAREYDTPNGSEGPEYVSFVAATAGTYRITVAPLEPGSQLSGNYVIKLLEMRQATDQELKDEKNLEGAKARGLALLVDIEDAIQQVKSPQTRIRYQLQAAQMLWESDEKRAAKFMTDATTGVKEFLAALDINDGEYSQRYQAITQLRFEIVQVLAARDPDAALSFLYSTVPQADPYGNRRNLLEQESGLELAIANQLIRKDPNRALEIARRNLKAGRSGGLNLTLMQLRRQKPELAAQLEDEIAAKLLNEKFLKNPESTNLLMNLVSSERASVKRGLPADGTAPAPPVEHYKELLQKALAEALSVSASQGYTPERDAAWNLLSGLSSLGPGLDLLAPGGTAAVEKKLTELSRAMNPQHDDQVKFQNMIADNPVDTALESIAKAPPEIRDSLYVQLAAREANTGDVTRAKQIINDHISNLQQRRQSLREFEEQGIYVALGKGKFEDALRVISNFRTPRERAGLVARVAGQIGPGLKRATALNVLEQARALLGPSVEAPDQDHMQALFEIARAFSRYDAKRALEIIEPLIDQFNELTVAARTLEGFGLHYYEDEELNLQDGNSIGTIASQMSSVLGAVALTNFDRAKTATDRIRLPEVRLKVYLDIAQQSIQ